MEIKQKDGRVINPPAVCQVPLCGRESAARLMDLTVPSKKRVDMCDAHAKTMKHHYPNDVEVIAVWNGLTMEDFDE